MAKQKLCPYEDSYMKELGWSEEDWHYYWYCMFHNAVATNTRIPDNVLKHYNAIPQTLIVKFLNNKEI